ncbi:MAG: hypothetical protein KAQ92_09145 [Candidatus Aenigmarchaeota archaeon]|nr:hypothetical protein [Candidatus Aenigmarchaeota archaeon]
MDTTITTLGNENPNKPATKLEEIDSVVRFDVPVGPKHPFYTDFQKVRGAFSEKAFYKSLNVNPITFKYDVTINQNNKNLIFLNGMRGSGKTSELFKYISKLDNPDCFFCIYCPLDEGLNRDNIEYMDIVIFQLNQLLQRIEEIQKPTSEGGKGVDLEIDMSIIESMSEWFKERIKEINDITESKIATESIAEVSASIPFLAKLMTKLTAGVTAATNQTDTIRLVMQNNFTEYAYKFNEFIETINEQLRKKEIAQEIFFVIDGLEKVFNDEQRRKIVVTESNRLSQINVNTVFTLPIELLEEHNHLRNFSTPLSFPFIKLLEKNGDVNDKAIKKFKEFLEKRIDLKLFESEKLIEEMIMMSGGSPRELLRIVEYANVYADEKNKVITRKNYTEALDRLSAEYSKCLNKEQLLKLKEIKKCNDKNKQIVADNVLLGLLKNLIVMEYNDGTYRRVNPIVEYSKLYKQEVLGQ